MGLENAGKTSILLSLQKKTNLMSYYKLNPTKGVQIVNINDIHSDYVVWDFGGQAEYRQEYLKDFSKYLIGSDKLIFVIDVQATETYDLALDYFEKIVEFIEKENIQLEISIFLHKFDADIQLNPNLPLVREDIPNLKKKLVSKIPKTIPYKFFKTSIFTGFQKIPDY